MTESLHTNPPTEQEIKALEHEFQKELELLKKSVISPKNDVIDYALRKIATLSEEESVQYSS